MLRCEAPKALIFDKDGTIIDVHHYWIEMSRLRIKILLDKLSLSSEIHLSLNSYLQNTLGIDQKEQKIRKNGPAGIKPRREIIQIIGEALVDKKLKLDTKDISDSFDEADEVSKKDFKKFLKLLPGVESMISKARDYNIDLNLVSNDITSRSVLALQNLGFLEDFNFVFGQDEVKNPKPSPDLALLILMKGKYKPNEIINIGDHCNDIKMGLNAGIYNNIALLTGLSKKKDFANLKCTILNTLEELSFF